MNKRILYIALCLGVFLFAGSGVFAQQQQQQTSDMDLNLGYDPQEIVDEWDEWYTNPTTQNAFIAGFMTQYSVPQTGQFGFTRLETWYWWASNNQYQVHQYILQRDQQNN